MVEFTIKPLKVAEIRAPIGVGMMLHDMTQTVDAPVFVWYIEGGREKILVDAGVGDPPKENPLEFSVRGGGERGLRNALEGVNTSPEEIDILILTHLHFDHVAFAKLFKNSRIYVQREEWEAALNPLPTSRPLYDRRLIDPLERLDLVPVEGDWEVSTGLKLLHLPGHTEGMQGVVVSTRLGKAVLASDLCYTYMNLNSPFPHTPFYPIGIYTDLRKWFDSVWKVVRTTTDRKLIYPGHDPTLEDKTLPEEE